MSDFDFADKKETILEMMREGALEPEIASFLGISRRNLRKYKMLLSDLYEILDLGETHSMSWWLKKGRHGLKDEKFNYKTWMAVMKNNFGYGERATEVQTAVENWTGTLEEKIAAIDDKLQMGEMSADVYSVLMRALNDHAKINEVTYIRPLLDKLELEQKLKNGEITQQEFDVHMQYVDAVKHVKEMQEVIIDRTKNQDEILDVANKDFYKKYKTVAEKKTRRKQVMRSELDKEMELLRLEQEMEYKNKADDDEE